MIVVPVKFRKVVMSECHIPPLAGHIHEQRTLFRIMAQFWFPLVNKYVAQFIIACAYFQLVHPCSRWAQHMLHKIESDAPFAVVFLDFWESGYIPDRGVYFSILPCLYCMTRFMVGAASRLK